MLRRGTGGTATVPNTSWKRLAQLNATDPARTATINNWASRLQVSDPKGNRAKRSRSRINIQREWPANKLNVRGRFPRWGSFPPQPGEEDSSQEKGGQVNPIDPNPVGLVRHTQSANAIPFQIVRPEVQQAEPNISKGRVHPNVLEAINTPPPGHVDIPMDVDEDKVHKKAYKKHPSLKPSRVPYPTELNNRQKKKIIKGLNRKLNNNISKYEAGDKSVATTVDELSEAERISIYSKNSKPVPPKSRTRKGKISKA